MKSNSLSHLSDQDLTRGLHTRAASERTATVDLLAYIAEFDARRLFLPAGYSSMYAYCVHEMGLSDDSALKRIRAGRSARQFTAIFDALDDGRLHLSGVAMLAKHLTPANAGELLAAAANKTCSEIALLLAERFPQPDVPTRIEPLSGRGVSSCQTLLAARPVDASSISPFAAATADPQARGQEPRSRVKPLSPGRFALQGTIAQSTYDKLEYARALLGHQVPGGEIAEVLDRALDALIAGLEKSKFAVTSKPRPARSSADPRHIPAHVKRAVLERDGGQCTFVSETGQRCGSRVRLEFDHVDPVACGGVATVEGVRLRCRPHNLYAAECSFGAGFMEHKREAARQTREEARARAAIENDPERSVVPWLRRLGYRLQEAREGAAYCERMSDAPMEERIRAALRYLSAGSPSPGRIA